MNAETLGKKGLRQEEILFSIVSQEKKPTHHGDLQLLSIFFVFLVKPFEYISGNKALTLRLGVSHSFSCLTFESLLWRKWHHRLPTQLCNAYKVLTENEKTSNITFNIWVEKFAYISLWLESSKQV